ncbi:2-phospho-L-lactate transferase CofD family protein [Saxibacter everestensis]|uniref:2-phospho-L-lactate transferase CofD family protein n=1 Tax=Saxibacter everestensis TaxID=2909229 RepID=A0ABY8QP35_9MICO|nr:2-phospho-L-lactate transferase CofD family protein [Brevibacteriaceae bacterium ZFBP1038]
MHITVLAATSADVELILALRDAEPDHSVTVVANTASDLTVHGLRSCPDLDALMYAMPSAVRTTDSGAVHRELTGYGVDGLWYELTDREMATLILRTRLLGLGYSLSQVTQALSARWNPPYALLPLSDDPIETHVVLADDGAERPAVAVHVQQWLSGGRQQQPQRLAFSGLDTATTAPGVLDAIRKSDIVILSQRGDPELTLVPALQLPGVKEALRGTRGLVLGLAGDKTWHSPGKATADELVAEWSAERNPPALASWILAHPVKTNQVPAKQQLWPGPDELGRG